MQCTHRVSDDILEIPWELLEGHFFICPHVAVTHFFDLWLAPLAGPPANRRGRGGGHRGRGRFSVRRDGPMKFEKDFDFESANAQFNKEEIDREFQSKLKLKGTFPYWRCVIPWLSVSAHYEPF